MADPSYVYMTDPRGVVVRLPMDQAPSAISLGYHPATPQQAQQFVSDAAHSGTGQAALAGLEGFGNALTLGLSTEAETGLGVDPEGIKSRERLNPGSHALGTGLGVLAPIILSGGAAAPEEAAALGVGEAAAETGALGAEAAAPSLLSQVSKVTAPSLISHVGKQVSEHVAGRLATEGVSPTVWRAIRDKAISGAAGSAAEGALYGIGDAIHEDALGDPVFSGEAAANIGMSTLLAGGLGAGLGAGSGLLGSISKKVGGLKGGALPEWLDDVIGNRNIKTAGAIQTDIKGKLKDISRDELQQQGKEMSKYGIVSPFASKEAVAENAARVIQDSTQDQASILSQARDASVPVNDLQAGLEKDVIRPALGSLPVPPAEFNYNAAAKEYANTYQQINDLVGGKVNEGFGVHRPAEVERLLKEVTPDAARAELKRVAEEVGNAARAIESNPRSYPNSGGYLKYLKSAESSLIDTIGDDSTQAASVRVARGLPPEGPSLDPATARAAILDVKRNLDPFTKFGTDPTATSKDVIGAAKKLRAFAKNSLENPDAWGELGTRERTFNKAFSELSSATGQKSGLDLGRRISNAQGSFDVVPSEGRIANHLKNIGKASNSIREDAIDRALKAQTSMVGQVAHSAAQGAAPIADEALAPLRARLRQIETAARDAADAKAEYKSEYKAWQESGKTSERRINKNARAVLNELQRFADSHTGEVSVKDLHDFAGRLEKIPQSERAVKHVNDVIADALKANGMTNPETEAYRRAARKIVVAKTARDFAEAAMTREHGNNQISPTEFIGTIGGLTHGLPSGLALGAITAGARRFGSGIISSAAQGLRDALEGEASHIPGIETRSAIGTLADHNAATKSAIKQSALKTIASRLPVALKSLGAAEIADAVGNMAQIRSLASNPQKMAALISGHTAGLSEHAPNVAQQASITLARAIAYLNSQMPQGQNPNYLNPKPGPPSRIETIKWDRKLQAILDPVKAMAEGGNPDAIAAIKAVYPALGSEYQSAVLTALADGKKPSYQEIQRLSSIIGIDLMPQLSGQALALANAPPPPAKTPHGAGRIPGAPRPSKSGLSKAHFGNSLRTPTQSLMSNGVK